MFRLLTPLLLVALLTTDTIARPPSPILTVEVGPTARMKPRPGTTQLELQVFKDGSFELEGRPGQLPREALRELQRQLAKTRVALLPPARVNCMAIPVRQTVVKTQRGTVSWASPCGRSPHPSVQKLLEATRPLLSRHLLPPPPAAELITLVSYQVTSHRSPMGGESLVLMSDGSWSHHNSRGARTGVLSAPELSAIRERMRSVRVGASPDPHPCAAMLEGQGTVTLEGRGTHTFSVPCSELDPSLASFLSELRSMTRR